MTSRRRARIAVSRSWAAASACSSPPRPAIANSIVADGEQLLQRAVVQRLGDAAAGAVLGVDRLGHEPAARGRDARRSPRSAARRSTASASTLAIAVRKAVSSSLKWSGRSDMAPSTPNGRVGPSITTATTLRAPAPALARATIVDVSAVLEQVADDDGLARGQRAVDHAARLDRDQSPDRRAARAATARAPRPLAAGQELERADAVDADLAPDRVARRAAAARRGRGPRARAGRARRPRAGAARRGRAP